MESSHAVHTWHRYPYNLDFNYGALEGLAKFSINNLGDPFIESNYGVHSREFEARHPPAPQPCCGPHSCSRPSQCTLCIIVPVHLNAYLLSLSLQQSRDQKPSELPSLHHPDSAVSPSNLSYISTSLLPSALMRITVWCSSEAVCACDVAQIGVLNWFAKLWEIENDEYWGYVTNCGTEGNLHGILVGRENLPDGAFSTLHIGPRCPSPFLQDMHRPTPLSRRRCASDSREQTASEMTPVPGDPASTRRLRGAGRYCNKIERCSRPRVCCGLQASCTLPKRHTIP